MRTSSHSSKGRPSRPPDVRPQPYAINLCEAERNVFRVKSSEIVGSAYFSTGIQDERPSHVSTSKMRRRQALHKSTRNAALLRKSNKRSARRAFNPDAGVSCVLAFVQESRQIIAFSKPLTDDLGQLIFSCRLSSRRRCHDALSSGIFIISCITFPAFATRSCSFFCPKAGNEVKATSRATPKQLFLTLTRRRTYSLANSNLV
jgi:hypothetical protein